MFPFTSETVAAWLLTKWSYMYVLWLSHYDYNNRDRDMTLWIFIAIPSLQKTPNVYIICFDGAGNFLF